MVVFYILMTLTNPRSISWVHCCRWIS